jgi:hypothetical protein
VEFIPGSATKTKKPVPRASASSAPKKAKRKIVDSSDDDDADDDDEGGGEAVDSSSTNRTAAASLAAAGDSPTDKGKKPAVKVKKVKLALASTMPVFGPTKKLPTTILMQSDINLQGDVATVGQVSINKHSDLPIGLDIKGTMLRGTLEKCNTYAMIEMAGDSFRITHIANSFVDIRDTVSMTDAENVFEGDDVNMDSEQFLDSEAVTSKKSDKAKVVSKKRKTPAKKGPAKKAK